MKKSLPVVFTLGVLLIIFAAVYFLKGKSGESKNVGGDQSQASHEVGQPSENGSGSSGDLKHGQPAGHDQASGGSGHSASVDSHGAAAGAGVNESGRDGGIVPGAVVQGATSGAAGGGIGAQGSAAANGGAAVGQSAGNNGQAVGQSAASSGVSGSVAGGVAAAGANGGAKVVPNGPVVETVNGSLTTKLPVPANNPSCARLKFQNQEKEFKVKRHELVLAQKLESKKDLCVTVNGEAVVFDLQDKNMKIVFDYRLKNKDAEVVATYCVSGKCNLTCPKPKKDFFDEISSESSDEVIKGFAGDQSAEEKQLQREVASLQQLLKEPNEKKKVIQWNESARNEGPCSQVVQAKN